MRLYDWRGRPGQRTVQGHHIPNTLQIGHREGVLRSNSPPQRAGQDRGAGRTRASRTEEFLWRGPPDDAWPGAPDRRTDQSRASAARPARTTGPRSAGEQERGPGLRDAAADGDLPGSLLPQPGSHVARRATDDEYLAPVREHKRVGIRLCPVWPD